jgi:NadR type nicotinamide-nucleotide adenylyltransferase
MVRVVKVKRAAHGLIVGKFYPPHAGHHLLVRAAARVCRRVSVLVMASSLETLPLERRLAWLREVHAADANVELAGGLDDVPIDLEDPAIWDAHEERFRATLATIAREPVDAVFTSERYGDELARRFGARHVCVDLARALAPISGSAARADLAAAWPWLEPPTRAGLALRVVVVGAESTGKTTLAAGLAEALRARGGAHGLTRWVPEHGRAYTAWKLAAARAEAALAGRPAPRLEELRWTGDDFLEIAAAQAAREEAEARAGGPVLICDTDVFATGVWHERYLGERSPAVEALATRGALYLLCDDDVAFVQDGLRDGEHLRRWMTRRFAERLEETGRRHVVLRGDRLAGALAAVAALPRGLTRPSP